MLTLHKNTPLMPKAVANALSAIGLDVCVVPSYYAHTPLVGFCVNVGSREECGYTNKNKAYDICGEVPYYPSLFELNDGGRLK